MQPTTVITRQELGKSFREFDAAANRLGFIAPKVLRPVLVGEQSGNIAKIPVEQILKTPETKRAPKSAYARVSDNFDLFAFATEDHGIDYPLDDRELKMYRSIFDAEGFAADRAVDSVLRRLEIDAATAVFNTTTWTGSALTTAAGTAWTTHASATPLANIEAAILKVRAGSGLMPNALVIPFVALHHLRRCAEVLDRVNDGNVSGEIKAASLEGLRKALMLDFIIVADGLKNTANESATASISDIWDSTKAMVCRVATTDDFQEPCVGRTFMWTEENAGAMGTAEELAVIVEEYAENGVRGKVIRARNDRQVKVIYPEAGHLLTGVTA